MQKRTDKEGRAEYEKLKKKRELILSPEEIQLARYMSLTPKDSKEQIILNFNPVIYLERQIDALIQISKKSQLLVCDAQNEEQELLISKVNSMMHSNCNLSIQFTIAKKKLSKKDFSNGIRIFYVIGTDQEEHCLCQLSSPKIKKKKKEEASLGSVIFYHEQKVKFELSRSFSVDCLANSDDTQIEFCVDYMSFSIVPVL